MDTHSEIVSAFGDNAMLKFAQASRRGILKQLTLNINCQNTLSGMTYDYIARLFSPKRLPMDRESFIRMWKTIMLKRVQDTSEILQDPSVIPANDVRLQSALLVPKTLGDILRALGRYESRVLGFIIDVVPPEPTSDQAHSWFEVDGAILNRWITMMRMVQHLYEIVPSPDANQISGSSIVLTAINDSVASGTLPCLRTVRSKTKEVSTLADLLRVANDDLFERPIDEFSNMGIENESSYHVPYIASVYVSSYKI